MALDESTEDRKRWLLPHPIIPNIWVSLVIAWVSHWINEFSVHRLLGVRRHACISQSVSPSLRVQVIRGQTQDLLGTVVHPRTERTSQQWERVAAHLHRTAQTESVLAAASLCFSWFPYIVGLTISASLRDECETLHRTSAWSRWHATESTVWAPPSGWSVLTGDPRLKISIYF